MSQSPAVALIAALLVGISANVTARPASAGDRSGLQPPQTDVPIPTERPDRAETAAPAPDAATPVPQPKPDQPPADDGKGSKGPKTEEPAADEKPAPATTPPAGPDAGKPDDTKSDKPESTTEAPGAETPEEAKAPPIEAEDEKDYAACLIDLKAAGAEFSETSRIDDGNGCGIDKPLVVREILPGIALKPEATMRCKTALQLNRWTKGSVLPSAELAFGTDKTIKAVNQATSYACRNRNSASSGKLSEHARGNAIDIAGFTFSDGSNLTIAPRERDSTLTGAFERAIMATGCLYFTTVLGPGSDAAHETHLHMDVIERKAGYRYCW